MDAKEQFGILYQSLVDGNREYVDFISKVIGVLLIAIGWLVANDDPFPVLGNRTLLHASLAAVVIGAGSIAWVSVFHLGRSRDRFEQLRNLNYADESVYAHYRISGKMVGPALFIHLGLFAVIFVLIRHQYGGIITCP